MREPIVPAPSTATRWIGFTGGVYREPGGAGNLPVKALADRRYGDGVAVQSTRNFGMNRLAGAQVLGPSAPRLKFFGSARTTHRVELHDLTALGLERERAGRRAHRA